MREKRLGQFPAGYFNTIIIDEAQDFGETVYYVIRRLLPGCYFTIMGDVSQNIRYETGMNDWEGLKEAMFEKENDSFTCWPRVTGIR